MTKNTPQATLPPHHVSPSMKIIMLLFAVILIAALGWFIMDYKADPGTTDYSATSVMKQGSTIDTSSWKTYANADPKFSYKYPADAFIPDKSDKKSLEGLMINNSVTVVSTAVDAPLGYTKADFEKNRTAITNNDPTVAFNFGLESSYKMVSAGSLKGKSFMTLGAFEICDVQFNQQAHFYIGKGSDYLVELTLQDARVADIQKANPSYFVADKDNCSGNLRWKDDGQKQFYMDLVAGKTDVLTQNWYKNFQGIVASFQAN